MDNNNKTTVWIILAVLLALLIVGVLVIRGKNTQEYTNTNKISEEMYDRTIDLKHQYKNGKHIFAGTIEVPTPCYQVALNVTPGDIAELNFETKDSGGVCAQVITDASFYVEFEGPENQLFIGKLNGEPINLNQFEIGADMDINTVDIFLKG
jgi:hypothetical protein